MITIGGVTISASEFSVDIESIVGENTQRNANAYLIAERIATKRKLSIRIPYMTQAEISALHDVFSANFFVSVTYLDPELGSVTKTFYPGNLQNPMLRYKGGTPTWKDIAFNLIER